MILRACARIFVSPFQFLFLFRASGALVFRGLDASSRVACARRRVSADKVLQLKPSVALTKSNNAMLHVRRRSDTFSIGTIIPYILPQRTFRASVPFPFSLFRVRASSSSASSSSGRRDRSRPVVTPIAAASFEPLGVFHPGRAQPPPTGSSRTASTRLDLHRYNIGYACNADSPNVDRRLRHAGDGFCQRDVTHCLVVSRRNNDRITTSAKIARDDSSRAQSPLSFAAFIREEHSPF